MREIVDVVPMEEYFLRITFDDSATEIVDMKPLMKRGVFKPLWNKDLRES